MARLVFTYKIYNLNQPILTELEFCRIKAILEQNPNSICFQLRAPYDMAVALFNEFKWELAILFGIGILIDIIAGSIGFFVIPLFLWLFFGGVASILNFLLYLRNYNKYNKILQDKFASFESYEGYLFFRKFEALKYF